MSEIHPYRSKNLQCSCIKTVTTRVLSERMQMWCFGVPSRRAHTEVCNRLREVPETPQMRLYDDTRKS